MDRTERFYRIQQRLRRAAPLDEFLAVLEVPRVTLIHDLEYLRGRLQVPIVWDGADRGYRLDVTAADQELPGLWFNTGEVYAPLTMQHLLEGMEPGWLEAQLAPVRERLERHVDAVSAWGAVAVVTLREDLEMLEAGVGVLGAACGLSSIPHSWTSSLDAIEPLTDIVNHL